MRAAVKYGFGVVGAVILFVAVFVAFVSGVGGLYTHDHGTLEVSIDGDRIDFDQPAYHDRHPTFHFHEGGGQEWHQHPETPLQFADFERMTVSKALETIDFEVTASAVNLDGTTYDDADSGTEVTVEVNGEPVEPGDHRLRDGDDVSIVVVTE